MLLLWTKATDTQLIRRSDSNDASSPLRKNNRTNQGERVMVRQGYKYMNDVRLVVTLTYSVIISSRDFRLLCILSNSFTAQGVVTWRCDQRVVQHPRPPTYHNSPPLKGSSSLCEVTFPISIAAYPLGLFSRWTFFFCSAHAVAPSRLERTTGKSEMLTNGVSTSYERLRKGGLNVLPPNV